MKVMGKMLRGEPGQEAGIDSKLFYSRFFRFPNTDVPPVLFLYILMHNY